MSNSPSAEAAPAVEGSNSPYVSTSNLPFTAIVPQDTALRTSMKTDTAPRGSSHRHLTDRSKGHGKRRKRGTLKDDAASSMVHQLDEGETANQADAEDEEENRAAVERLCAQYPNTICSDCGTSGTRWASVNHGVFLCIRCAGVHRSLGVHVSKVKSTNMDHWTLAEARLMEAIGNAKAKTLYEANGALLRPSGGSGGDAAEDALASFIHRKYVEREFAIRHLSDVLHRLYKDTGYTRSKKGSKHRDLPKAGASSPAAELNTVASSVDRATATVKRGDTVRALYGDAAADRQSDSVRCKREVTGSAASQPTYGTFGMVNVPLDEYEARWRRTRELFTLVESPNSAVAAAPARAASVNADPDGASIATEPPTTRLTEGTP